VITNEQKLDALTDAAMEIYKLYEKGKGFFSGHKRDEESNKSIEVYNDWETGLRRVIETRLKRHMTKYEQTVIALAIGAGPTPAMTKAERKYSMEFLWGEEYPENFNKYCHDLMKVLTSF